MIETLLAILLASPRDELMCHCAGDPLRAIQVDGLTPDEYKVAAPSIVITKIDAPGRRAYARVVNPLAKPILIECAGSRNLRLAVATPSLVEHVSNNQVNPVESWHEVPARSSTFATAHLPERAVDSPLVLRWKHGLGEPPQEMSSSVVSSRGALRELTDADGAYVAPSLAYLGPANSSPWCARYRFELINPYDRVVRWTGTFTGAIEFTGGGASGLDCVFPWDPNVHSVPARTALVVEGPCRLGEAGTARTIAHVRLVAPDLIAHSFAFDVPGEQVPIDARDSVAGESRPFTLQVASIETDWGEAGVRFELANASDSDIHFLDPSWGIEDSVFLRDGDPLPPIPHPTAYELSTSRKLGSSFRRFIAPELPAALDESPYRFAVCVWVSDAPRWITSDPFTLADLRALLRRQFTAR